MSRTMRKSFLYGLLLIAGVTLGIQLASTDAPNPSITGPAVDKGIAGEQVKKPSTSEVSDYSGYVIINGVTYYSSSFLSNLAQGGDQKQGQEQAPSGVLETPADLLLPPASPPAVDQFADKAAQLLQDASRKGIHWVASLFRSVE